MAVSEPFPLPISQAPAAGSDAHHPLPVDTDFLPGIVWDPNKKSPGVGGYVLVKVSYGQIFNLPINTTDALGLIQQVESAKAASLVAMANALKASKQAKANALLAETSSSRAAAWASYAASFFRKARSASSTADLFAKEALGNAGAASMWAGASKKWFFKTRREFSDDQIMLKAQVFNG